MEKTHDTFRGIERGTPLSCACRAACALRASRTARPRTTARLLTLVTDLRSQAAELRILEATTVGAGPVAAIEIPAWVLTGVHGQWLDDRAA